MGNNGAKRVEPCRIREIPFFQNYYVYLQLKDNAKKQKVTYGHYMVDLLLDYCRRHNYDVPTKVGTPKTYHEVCEKVASIEGILVSQVIEKIAVESVGLSYQIPVAGAGGKVADGQKKGSFFDLNRDARQ
jgi:hypothetical protein